MLSESSSDRQWPSAPASSLISCVSYATSINLSGPQFAQLVSDLHFSANILWCCPSGETSVWFSTRCFFAWMKAGWAPWPLKMSNIGNHTMMPSGKHYPDQCKQLFIPWPHKKDWQTLIIFIKSSLFPRPSLIPRNQKAKPRAMVVLKETQSVRGPITQLKMIFNFPFLWWKCITDAGKCQTSHLIASLLLMLVGPGARIEIKVRPQTNGVRVCVLQNLSSLRIIAGASLPRPESCFVSVTDPHGPWWI